MVYIYIYMIYIYIYDVYIWYIYIWYIYMIYIYMYILISNKNTYIYILHDQLFKIPCFVSMNHFRWIWDYTFTIPKDIAWAPPWSTPPSSWRTARWWSWPGATAGKRSSAVRSTTGQKAPAMRCRGEGWWICGRWNIFPFFFWNIYIYIYNLYLYVYQIWVNLKRGYIICIYIYILYVCNVM